MKRSLGRACVATVAALSMGAVGFLATVSPAVASVASVASVTAVAPEPLPGTATTKFLSGWLPYWRGNAEIDRILPRTGADGYLDEVNAFWVYSRYNGAIQAPVCVHDGSDVKSQECALTAPTSGQQGHLARLHGAGVKVLPSFTDDSSKLALSAVLRDPTRRAWHISQQVKFVNDNGFDGLDLDYEDFAFTDGKASWAVTKPAWIAYITELAAQLHINHKVLSVTVPAGYPVKGAGFAPSSGYWVYAWADIINAVDRLRLMTYDYSWDTPGAIGPADWVDEVAADAVEELGAANAHKVWLGVAAYGYDWRTATTCPNPSGSKYTRYPAQAIAVYNDAAANLNRRTLVPGSFRWDATKAEYTYQYVQRLNDPVTTVACNQTREVWFQDGRSHERRALIAAKYRLGGIALWAFGDETDSTWSRLSAAAASIKPYRPALTLSLPTKVVSGQSVVVGVTVRRPDASADPQVPVTLQWRGVGSTQWTTVATADSSADGVATFTHFPTRNGEYRASSPPAVGRQSAVSLSKPTTVATAMSVVVRNSATAARLSAVVNDQVTVSVRRGTPTQLWGYATPVAGQRVVLYRQAAGGAWTPIASRVITAAGAYSFAVDTTVPGTTIYQVRSGGTTVYAMGRTMPILVKVRP